MRKRFAVPQVLAFAVLSSCASTPSPNCNTGSTQACTDGGMVLPDGGCDCGSGCPAGSCFYVPGPDGGGGSCVCDL